MRAYNYKMLFGDSLSVLEKLKLLHAGMQLKKSMGRPGLTNDQMVAQLSTTANTAHRIIAGKTGEFAGFLKAMPAPLKGGSSKQRLMMKTTKKKGTKTKTGKASPRKKKGNHPGSPRMKTKTNTKRASARKTASPRRKKKTLLAVS